jgi:flagellar biosynthetic protein FliP
MNKLLSRLLPLLAFALLLFPCAAFAQSLSLDLGHGPTTSSRLIQLILLVTVLSVAPSILIMVTSFTRITVVLSLVRSAMGLQSTPPNMVLVSLALFLTFFIMQPVFNQAWETGVKPLMNNEIDEETSFARSVEPFHAFMLKHTREKDLNLFAEMAKKNAAAAETAKPPKVDKVADSKNQASAKAPAKPDGKAEASGDIPAQEAVPLHILIPSFMISELRRAFEIGFLVFLPFLIIDMVIASILMSMGMMMLPPSVISLPFKIVFFVLVDGWYMLCGSLVQSYS